MRCELEEQRQWAFLDELVGELAEDDSHNHNDAEDHDECDDCKGSGWYVGFNERSHCATCDGSGWL